MSYYFFTMKLQPTLIVFLMLLYVMAPVIDAVACDDCADPAPLQQAVKTMELQNARSAGNPGGDHAFPSPGTAKDLCPLCANAVVGIAAVKGSAPVETVQCVTQPKLLAFVDPSFPIIKPPQN
jgi:hypothetical protein